VNVVSFPNQVIPHPLIERSGNHPTGAHQRATMKLRETTPNMSFGPKVVDWACSLQKTKKWFRWKKLVLCMHPDNPFSEWVTCDNEIAQNHPKHEFWT
jgi:hypothetical protein